MPQKIKTVQIAGQELRLTWTRWRCKDLSVYFNDQLLWAVESRAELRLGRSLALPDGSRVTVIWASPHGLEVWYNGREMLSGQVSGYLEPTLVTVGSPRTAWLGLVEACLRSIRI